MAKQQTHDQASKQTQNETESTVIEQGNIYFCYRPKVEHESVNSLDDVQQFYIVLQPNSKCYRMIVVGQKQLPDLSNHGQQAWCFVDIIRNDPKEIEQVLREQHYQTKTRGDRTLPAARPVGEGVYDIVRHHGHDYLAYALELPHHQGSAQKALRIASEGSYVVSIKNPERPAANGAGLQKEQKAHFPQSLQAQMGDRAFVSVNTPDYLNYEGAELLLIAAADDVHKELGITLEPEEETENTAEILNNLRMRKSRHPIEPLLSGEWR